jgi:hypothetical protein
MMQNAWKKQKTVKISRAGNAGLKKACLRHRKL